MAQLRRGLLFVAIQICSCIHTDPAEPFTASMMVDGSAKLHHAKGSDDKLRHQRPSGGMPSLAQKSSEEHSRSQDAVQQSIADLNAMVGRNQRHLSEMEQLMDDLRSKEGVSASLLQEGDDGPHRRSRHRSRSRNGGGRKQAASLVQVDVENRVRNLEESMGNSICTRKMSLTGEGCGKGKQNCKQVVEIANYNLEIGTSKDTSKTGGSLISGSGHDVRECKNCFLAGFQHTGFGNSQSCVGGQQSKCGDASNLESQGMVVIGGSHGKASGEKSTSAGGWKNTVTGQGGSIIGGFENVNEFRYSVVSGSQGRATKDNSLVITACSKSYATVANTPAPCDSLKSSSLQKNQTYNANENKKHHGHDDEDHEGHHHEDDDHEYDDDHVVDDS